MTKTRKCTIPLEHVPVLFTRHLTRKSFISLAMLNSRKLVQNYYVKKRVPLENVRQKIRLIYLKSTSTSYYIRPDHQGTDA